MNHLNLYWGEIHNHNEIGYGLGSLERSYHIARNSLDFYAFTPHGWWVDPPENDPAIKTYHIEGSERVLGQWNRVVQAAEDHYRKGEFVTFPAYEWHSSQWGDWCVYFPDGNADLYRAPDIHALKAYARQKGALLIPHHCAYKEGWRGTNWPVRDPELSPVSEIFSEHGCSLETASPFGITRHSMGGSCRSQTIMERLIKGDVTGFTAGTDNHDGHPGSYGEGLTAVYAAELTRESIRDAFQKRHTYAVTGDRIEMLFGTPGAFMGDIVSASQKRDFCFNVLAQDEIEYVMIMKNGVAGFITAPVPARKEPGRV